MLTELVLGGGLLQTCLLGVAVFLLFVWLLNFRKRWSMPPGPPGLPFVGNLLQLIGVISFRQFYKWSKIYGPAITVQMGPKPVVVLNNIEVVLEALVKRGSDYATRAKMASFDAFSDGGRDIAFGEYGPLWKTQRKISSKALRLYMQGEQLETRIHNALRKAFVVMDENREPYDPTMYMNLIVANITCGLCFGQSYDFHDPEFRKVLELRDASIKLPDERGPVFIEDLVPVLAYCPTRKLTDFRNIMNGLHAIFGQKFEEHAATFNRDNIRDFTDLLLLAKMEADEDARGDPVLAQLTDRYLKQTISDIFLAGLDTTRTTLLYALVHMAAYTDIQTKVQEELDSVLAAGQFPCVRHRSQLPYTEAVLHESMRLASIAPCGVAHVTLRDTKILNYDVPKGTDVIINHWALHHDQDKWTDVDEFIPERYLDANGKIGPKPESWLPFSAGRRVCLGESVAKPELHLIFAALLHRYRWEAPEGEKIDTRGVETFILISPKPCKLVGKKRF